MASQLDINQGFKANSPLPLDGRTMKVVTEDGVITSAPFASKAEALLEVPIEYRHIGLTQYILKNGRIVQHQFKNGVADADLVEVFTSNIASVQEYGATGDAVLKADGAITAGDATFTSASSAFVDADAGKGIIIKGAGAAGAELITTIASVTSATTVELAANAATTVSGATFTYGTNDQPAIQTAFNALVEGQTLNFPRGNYFLTSPLTTSVDRTRFTGDGALLIYGKNISAIVISNDHCEVDHLNFRSTGLATANGAAIFLQTAHYNNIHDNRIDEPSANGIAIFAGSSFNQVYKNLINGKLVYTTTGADFSAILLGYADLTPVKGNNIADNTLNGNDSLKCGVALIGAGSYNSFKHNYADGFREYGYLLYESSLQPDYAVIRNSITDNYAINIGSAGSTKAMGIYLQQAHHTNVSRNHCKNCAVSAVYDGLTPGGITLDGCKYVSLCNNIVEDISTDFPAFNINNSFHVNASDNIVSDTFIGFFIRYASYVTLDTNNIVTRQQNIAVEIDTSVSTIAVDISSIPTGLALKITNNTGRCTTTGSAALTIVATAASPAIDWDILNNTFHTNGSGIQASYLLKSNISSRIIGTGGTGVGIQLDANCEDISIYKTTIRRTTGVFDYGINSEALRDKISGDNIISECTVEVLSEHPAISDVETHISPAGVGIEDVAIYLKADGFGQVKFKQRYNTVEDYGLQISVAGTSEFEFTNNGVVFNRLSMAQRDAIVNPADWLTITVTDETAIDAATGVTQQWNPNSLTWKKFN